MAKSITDKQFHRIHLFIGEGRVDEALAALEQIQSANEREKQEVAYLRAWCYAERGSWSEAAQFLSNTGVSEEAVNDIQALGQTERRRRAYYQLLMGDIASNLGHHEEGMRHYRKCISFLDERRMNIPDVRIRALLAIGTISVITGFYDLALTHYEEALRLCGETSEHPNLPDIYYGLCDLYRQKGSFLRALDCGKQALQLYSERSQQSMVGRIRNLLGRISYQMRDFQAAGTYYTEALALAMLGGSSLMILNNLTALADLRREEGELAESWRYCDMALEYSLKLPAGTGHFGGMAYIVCGKVKEAEAQEARGQQSKELLEQAVSYYEQAVQALQATGARVVLGEAYQRLAQTLEASGRQDLAMAHWKSAYSVSSNIEDFSVF
ncbi:MAG TPA: tetratricopeptide repeat protein [Ktedonobacteraceae bacterium]